MWYGECYYILSPEVQFHIRMLGDKSEGQKRIQGM
jgi:hypothetical protein